MNSGIWGRNGYVELTPHGVWFACTIWERAEAVPAKIFWLAISRFIFDLHGRLSWMFRGQHRSFGFLRRLRDWTARKGYPVLGDLFPLYTQIKPNHADPLFMFRTKENSPWLPDEDIRAFNALYNKTNVGRASVATEFNSYWTGLYEKKYTAQRHEPVYKRWHASPLEAFEIAEGGWVPNGGVLIASGTANHIVKRLACKARGDYAAADVIRKIIEDGSVEVRDTMTGTFWFFAE